MNNKAELKRRLTVLAEEERAEEAQNPTTKTEFCLDEKGNLTIDFRKEL